MYKCLKKIKVNQLSTCFKSNKIIFLGVRGKVLILKDMFFMNRNLQNIESFNALYLDQKWSNFYYLLL